MPIDTGKPIDLHGPYERGNISRAKQVPPSALVREQRALQVFGSVVKGFEDVSGDEVHQAVLQYRTF